MAAVKLPVVAPAATVKLAGTLTAELLLARLTANPPFGAGPVSVTVQLSVPAPVTVELPQVSPLNCGGLGPTWLLTLSCKANVSDTPPALAVNVTVWAVLTAETFVAKLTVVPPAATVTLAGTLAAVLSLARLTANPPLVAGPVKVTVQLSVPDPVIDDLPQRSPDNAGGFGLTGLGASTCSANVSATPPALAVIVAVWVALTA
jgi:hypothetical protein